MKILWNLVKIAIEGVQLLSNDVWIEGREGETEGGGG